ncbi:dihydrofolate reductase [Marinicrinis sediminis]|uniref:Dihydrofolate reductase n=1 Tax=Marinicrinis sediminis TaxID=1652465 RepID=A0ABW5RDD9_9BACL
MIALIWAMGENRVIGKNNQMPWHLPADLTYFKQTTMGAPVLMGRKTFESIGKPLPGRENWILTTNQDYVADGCKVVHTVDELLEQLKQDDEPNDTLFVIGGAQIYRQFLAVADRLYVTHIHQAFEGDTFFPDYDAAQWRLVQQIEGQVNERNPYPHDFCVYERIGSSDPAST